MSWIGSYGRDASCSDSGPPPIANGRRCANISGSLNRIAAATGSRFLYIDFSGACAHANPAWKAMFTPSSHAATRRARGESTNDQQ